MISRQNAVIPECLKNYLLIDTGSMEQAHDAAARSFVPHKLQKLDNNPSFHFRHSHAFLPKVSLSYTSYGSKILLEPGAMKDFYLIQIPVSGQIDVHSGGQHCLCHGTFGSIVSATEHTQMQWSNNAGLMTVKIQRQALEKQLQKLIRADLSEPVVFDIEMPLSEQQYHHWHIAVLRLMQYFQYPNKAEIVSLEGGFENRLIETLLISQNNNYSELIKDGDNNSLSKPVDLAIEYMHEHLAEKITLSQLADITDVTARTLHNGFKKYRNLSPMEYLSNIRMQEARRNLLKAKQHENITSIAQASGFSHLGRFSQKFFEQFGELPSETLKNNKHHKLKKHHRLV